MSALPARWNAAEYAAHSSLQQNWARELAAKLHLRGDERILDVGCGDGKVTAELARSVPHGSVAGVDASPPMIAFAKKVFPATKHSNLLFRVMDARHLRFPRRFDVFFSNAALHWVDDHQAIFRGAARVLKTGGHLLVSCGGKGNAQDVFIALRPVLRLARWRTFFRRMPKPYFFYAPENYHPWLARCGFKSIRVELAPIDAVYNGKEGVAAWLRTTWLPYTQRVPEAFRDEFIAAVADRYIAAHPPDESGRIHVRMVRLEIQATRT